MKKFKAESQRMLELMINSIYTNKEIFLRELVSNASDAIDKLHFLSLTDPDFRGGEFRILIAYDEKARTITISDNGIGMDSAEMEQNLGTIAKSGTLSFKKESGIKDELIGQFGVGFYSAFMVAANVSVMSRKYGSDKAYCWESSGSEGYELSECEKESYGTDVVLQLKEDDADFQYSSLLSEYKLRELIKKYSDYIRYPIVMSVTNYDKEDIETKQPETINSMVPIWKRGKKEVTTEEYTAFFRSKYYEFEDPMHIIPAHIEGNINYDALIYIPAHPPQDYFTKEYKKGLELYSAGVLIMEKCSDLIPEYLGFIRGLVDSADLSLNISREMLQKDRQLAAISKSLEKKIVSELKKMLENDRALYEKFFKEYGTSLKFGLYNNFGEKKEELKDLIVFRASGGESVTLKEYTASMREDQKYIYYASGRSFEAIDMMPQTELLKEKGYSILYLTDHVDEFMIKILGKYDGKDFMSAAAKDVLAADEDTKQAVDLEAENSKQLLEYMKDKLGGRVKDVRLSYRMRTQPVCLSADGELSLEMERVLKAIDGSSAVKAERVLEINSKHPVFERLKGLMESDKELLGTYTVALYNEALLLEGLPLDDARELIDALNLLLARPLFS